MSVRPLPEMLCALGRHLWKEKTPLWRECKTCGQIAVRISKEDKWTDRAPIFYQTPEEKRGP